MVSACHLGGFLLLGCSLCSRVRNHSLEIYGETGDRKVIGRAEVLFSCTSPISLASHNSFFLELKVRCFPCPWMCFGKVSVSTNLRRHYVATENILSIIHCLEKSQHVWRPLYDRPQGLPGEASFLLLPRITRTDAIASECLRLFRPTSCQFSESHYS